MNPDEDALIIREHARLREYIMNLTLINHHGQYCVSREGVLKLLQLTEPDKLVTDRPRISYTRD